MIEWFAQRGRWTAAVLGTLAIFVGIGAYVLLDREPGEEAGEYLPVPYMSDDENRVRERVWEQTYRPAVRRGRIGEADLRELLPYLDPSQPYHVRDFTISVMGELLHNDVKMSDASREIIVQSYLTMLRDEEWGLRRLAVSYVIVTGMLQDQRVHDVVRKMADDPHEKVARHVNRIDWTDPKHGG